MSEQDEQVLDATNSNEELDLELDLDDTEDVEAVEEKTYSESQFKQVLARAKKAEAEAKALKPKQGDATQNINNNNLSEESIDIKILKSQGMSDELLKELTDISKLRNKSPLEMQLDPLFLAIKKQREDEAKFSKAKLGASRGSGQVKKDKSVSSPGLTDSEHKALWREQNGN